MLHRILCGTMVRSKGNSLFGHSECNGDVSPFNELLLDERVEQFFQKRERANNEDNLFGLRVKGVNRGPSKPCLLGFSKLRC
jgi:hypothetical protein